MNKKTVKRSMDARERLRLAILIVLVLVSAALLIPKSATEGAQDTAATSAPASPTPAPDARSAREIAYDKDVATLERLAGNGEADESTRAMAGERLARLVSDHQSELGIEEALRQAGFNPCLVLMQNGSLSVMVSERELSGAQSVTILSVCAAHSDIGVENIRIMTGQEL